MNNELVTTEDISFLTQQSQSELNMILAGMTSLIDDTNNKVKILEDQTWFQRMYRTVLGKNKATQQDIQRNHEKLSLYSIEAIAGLYEKNCVSQQAIMSLGNQINELYINHIKLKQMLGELVFKLNEKIESIDNFHMLNTEISQGIYSSHSPLAAICAILSQLDKRSIQDARKMNVLKRTMQSSGLISDTLISMEYYLFETINIPYEDVGSTYLELSTISRNPMSKVMMLVIENYHFLNEMARKMKSKNKIIDSVVYAELLDPKAEFSTSQLFESFIDSKLLLYENMVPNLESGYEQPAFEVNGPTDSSYFIFDEISGSIKGYSDDGPKDVIIPAEINGIPVTVIGPEAFANSNLTSVEISDSVTYIGYKAFANNNLSSINIPKSVSYIRSETFADNNLTSVEIPYSVHFIKSKAFANNNLSSVVLPESVSFDSSSFDSDVEVVQRISKYLMYSNFELHNYLK